MKASLLTKLESLADRHQEVEALLGDAEVISDQNRFRDLSVEFAHLNDVVMQYQRWQQLQVELEDARQLLEDSDAEIKALATEEVAEASATLEEIESALQGRLGHLLTHPPRGEPPRFPPGLGQPGRCFLCLMTMGLHWPV